MYDTYTTTQRVIAEVLTENTGRHMLDSGDYYGRHWQRNQGRNFLAEEATSLTFRWGFVEVVHNLFHWLDNALEFDQELDTAFAEWSEREENERLPWLACPEPFLEHLRELGAEVGGIYGEGEPFTHNTYNGQDLLSQTIQYTFARIRLWDDERGLHLDDDYVLLSVHGGCDVRGGYTRPRAFRLKNELSILDNARAVVFCDCCTDDYGSPTCWSTDDGVHWYRQGICGIGTRLEEMQLFKVGDEVESLEPALRTASESTEYLIVVDEDGAGYCPACCNGRLAASQY